MHFWLCLLLFQNKTNSFVFIQDYNLRSIPGKENLTFPASFDFDSSGNLYVLDSSTSHVYTWSSDGKFRFFFGRSGQGPGEFSVANRLNICNNEIYILDNFRKMIIVFSLDGNYIRTLKTPLFNYKNFAILNKNILLPYSTTDGNDSPDEHIAFSLYNPKGKKLKDIISFKIGLETHQDAYPAYSPDYDIQRNKKGELFISFSSQPKIWQISPGGQILSTKSFPLPTRPPNDDEIKISKDVTWPSLNGEIGKWDGFVKLDYKKPMSYFTHFLIVKDKVIFTLTPIGGYIGLPHGYSHGSYRICDFKTGKLLSKGSYHLPDGSCVLYHNERIILYYQPENTEAAELKEITIKEL